MANRRIEVHEYREVLYRVRQGQTLRAIDRSKLMGRRKAQVLIKLAEPLGWLDPAVELPDNATIAQALRDHRAQSKTTPKYLDISSYSGCGSSHVRRKSGRTATPDLPTSPWPTGCARAPKAFAPQSVGQMDATTQKPINNPEFPDCSTRSPKSVNHVRAQRSPCHTLKRIWPANQVLHKMSKIDNNGYNNCL